MRPLLGPGAADFPGMPQATPKSRPTACVSHCLTSQIGSEHHGIEILAARETIHVNRAAPGPPLPPPAGGVINRRGRILPGIDLRVRFGVALPAQSPRACVVVVPGSASTHATSATGLVVDAIDDVVSVAAAEIYFAPDWASRIDPPWIPGRATGQGATRMLLDLDRLLAAAGSPGEPLTQAA